MAMHRQWELEHCMINVHLLVHGLSSICFIHGQAHLVCMHHECHLTMASASS